MAGIKASNGNHCRLSRGRGGAAAATGVRDDGKRAPPGGSAKAGAAATRVDDGKRAPPGGSPEAGAEDFTTARVTAN